MRKLDQIGKVLTKEQQKKISGGASSCSYNGSTGSWTYDNNTQPSDGQIRRDVRNYCSTGSATCSGCKNIQ